MLFSRDQSRGLRTNLLVLPAVLARNWQMPGWIGLVCCSVFRAVKAFFMALMNISQY